MICINDIVSCHAAPKTIHLLHSFIHALRYGEHLVSDIQLFKMTFCLWHSAYCIHYCEPWLNELEPLFRCSLAIYDKTNTFFLQALMLYFFLHSRTLPLPSTESALLCASSNLRVHEIQRGRSQLYKLVTSSIHVELMRTRFLPSVCYISEMFPRALFSRLALTVLFYSWLLDTLTAPFQLRHL
jgi:hypothetical protein